LSAAAVTAGIAALVAAAAGTAPAVAAGAVTTRSVAAATRIASAAGHGIVVGLAAAATDECRHRDCSEGGQKDPSHGYRP
jgi:hypothetical protein